jgi:hypothetical protein
VQATFRAYTHPGSPWFSLSQALYSILFHWQPKMKLPNRENAYIEPQKLYDYLLSKIHPVGMWKARFFRAHGFDETNSDLLKQQLMAIIHSEDVKDVTVSPFGTKYIIDGAIKTPAGSTVKVRTVWIIDEGEDRPRLVTAFPG